MGMRHVVVVNGELEVVGIITRSEMNEHHLAHFWKEEVSLHSHSYLISYRLLTRHFVCICSILLYVYKLFLGRANAKGHECRQFTARDCI